MRTFDSSAQEALESGHATISIFLTLEFTGGILRLNTSRYDIESPDTPGDTYYGTGILIQIDSVEDKVRDVTGVQVTASGADTGIIAVALGEQVRGRPMSIDLAVLNSTTHVVLDVIPIWAGKMSTMALSMSQDKATVTIAGEHNGVLFAMPKTLRYTDVDQQKLFPGDRSLEFIVAQSQAQDVWPAASWGKQ